MPARGAPRWPSPANKIRLEVMRSEERIAAIARELLKHEAISSNDALRALVYEALALAERSRRMLGEAKPGKSEETRDPSAAVEPAAEGS